MFLQIASSLALIARRFVVPACFGHMLVLVTGIWLFHAPHWFVIGPDNVVGPGKEGVEYSTLLITCFISILIAYWPKNTFLRRSRKARGEASGPPWGHYTKRPKSYAGGLLRKPVASGRAIATAFCNSNY
jgi:hypothetical protein